jgi:hypothetical protein
MSVCYCAAFCGSKQEVVESVKPMAIAMHRFVSMAVEHGLAKSSNCRFRIGKLFARLVKEQYLTPEDFTFG